MSRWDVHMQRNKPFGQYTRGIQKTRKTKLYIEEHLFKNSKEDSMSEKRERSNEKENQQDLIWIRDWNPLIFKPLPMLIYIRPKNTMKHILQEVFELLSPTLNTQIQWSSSTILAWLDQYQAKHGGTISDNKEKMVNPLPIIFAQTIPIGNNPRPLTKLPTGNS